MARYFAICGSDKNLEVHHLKHIRKMGSRVTGFSKIMASLNRKQIVICRKCHGRVHNGQYDGVSLSDI